MQNSWLTFFFFKLIKYCKIFVGVLEECICGLEFSLKIKKSCCEVPKLSDFPFFYFVEMNYCDYKLNIIIFCLCDGGQNIVKISLRINGGAKNFNREI